MTKIITVGLGERAYAIHVGTGLMAEAGELLTPFARGPRAGGDGQPCRALHLARFLDVLARPAWTARPIVMPAGEASKSFAGLEN